MQEKNQIGLLTMDDGIVNQGEHTKDEETNHALMAISSSSEVSLCSKTCLDSYNTLKTLCDEQMNQLGDQEAQILAYSQAVKKLEAQLKTFDSWKDSSKNLWRLINSSMSLSSKIGLGYEIQSNNEVLSYEEEINCSVFMCTEEDYVNKPLYSRFTKTNNFKRVAHPLSGDYTSKPQEEIDNSLYVYGKKGPQEPEPSVLDDRSNEHSTYQSNDNEGSIGNSSEHSVDPESENSNVPQEVSKPVTTNEKGVSAPKSKEVEPSCVTYIKTPRQPIKDQETPKVNRKNWNAMMERELGEGYSFTKKKCFVCGCLSHLIKDCDYYEKKMAREAELKKQRVVNTSNGVARPVWTNADRINHANQFVPRPVQLNAGRPNINSVRPNINTGRTNINSVRPRVNIVNSNVNSVRSKQQVPTKISNSFSHKRPQGDWGSAVKTLAGSSTQEHGIAWIRRCKEGLCFIVDFLRGSNLMYALTTNPTIYDSLVKQFWQTATANTLANGTLELHTTIDTTVYTITEASIRNKLQLADASGITMLPNNEIFEGMGHMGILLMDLLPFGKAFSHPNGDF
ncbi:hypothetical protein Tco_0175515 [Tanacetum coccineum]